MKKIIHAVILIIIGLLCMGGYCRCPIPFTPIGEFEIWTVAPEDEDTIHESEVTLTWSYSIGHAKLVTFFLMVDTTPDFHDVEAIETVDTTRTITSLKPSTTYYWKVVAWYMARGGNETEGTDILSFTTADEFYVPGQVHTPTPDSGAIGVSVNPYFAWEIYNPDLTPYDFDIYLDTTSDTANLPLLVSGLSAPWYTLSSDTLNDSTLYYWRVESIYGTDTVKGPLWEFRTDYPSDVNIFALLEIDVKQAPSGYHLEEEFRARFDTGTAIDAPIEPLQADSVFVEDVELEWSASSQNYSYIPYPDPYIENGQSVDFMVYGNTDVPDLNTNIIFPACTLGIISPESFNTVSISGFEVTWDGSECGGTVWLTLTDGNDSTGVWKEVANDGLDSLTASDLAPLGSQTGSYDLIILKQVEENIDAPGYRTESLIRARAYNVMPQINITSSK